MSQNFRNAVAKSSNRRKVTVRDNYIEVNNGSKKFIDRYVFYKNDEILDENEIVMVISGSEIPNTTIQIPVPAVRREVKMDGKFFMVKNSALFDLYCPYYYFFFEDDTEKEVRGWKSYLFNAQVSKLDPAIRYVHTNTPVDIVEDPIKKKEVLDLYAERFKIKKRLNEIDHNLIELDPDGDALSEYEAVMEKMKGSTGMFSNLKGVL